MWTTTKAFTSYKLLLQINSTMEKMYGNFPSGITVVLLAHQFYINSSNCPTWRVFP